MQRSDYTQANRKAWNEAAKVHQARRGEALKRAFSTPGHSTLDAVMTGALDRIGLGGKRVAHLCCNNGIELLSVLNLGAAGGTGFDISDEAVAEARELAAIGGLSAEFVQTDVYEIPARYEDAFDLLLFTIGGLCWLPDLDAVFALAARLLRRDGVLLIYDLHPFTLMLPVPGEPSFADAHRLEYDYFAREPLVSTDGIDYLGHTTYAASPKYDFPHTLGAVFGALLGAGFTIREFNEYPHDISNLFGHLEGEGRVPLCYLLRAEMP